MSNDLEDKPSYKLVLIGCSFRWILENLNKSSVPNEHIMLVIGAINLGYNELDQYDKNAFINSIRKNLKQLDNLVGEEKRQEVENLLSPTIIIDLSSIYD